MPSTRNTRLKKRLSSVRKPLEFTDLPHDVANKVLVKSALASKETCKTFDTLPLVSKIFRPTLSHDEWVDLALRIHREVILNWTFDKGLDWSPRGPVERDPLRIERIRESTTNDLKKLCRRLCKTETLHKRVHQLVSLGTGRSSALQEALLRPGGGQSADTPMKAAFKKEHYDRAIRREEDFLLLLAPGYFRVRAFDPPSDYDWSFDRWENYAHWGDLKPHFIIDNYLVQWLEKMEVDPSYVDMEEREKEKIAEIASESALQKLKTKDDWAQGLLSSADVVL